MHVTFNKSTKSPRQDLLAGLVPGKQTTWHSTAGFCFLAAQQLILDGSAEVAEVWESGVIAVQGSRITGGEVPNAPYIRLVAGTGRFGRKTAVRG